MIETMQMSHTCPICGSISPCIFTTSDINAAFRYHDCRFCGSTWKEAAQKN